MDTIYITNPNYASSTISGLTVIIPISENCPKFNGMMKLTGIAPFLWEIFSKGSTFSNALKLVIEKYDVSIDTAANDIKDFIDSLIQNGLMSETK